MPSQCKSVRTGAHIEQAAAADATMRGVLEAVEREGGPATVSARFALEVMEGVFASEMR